MRVPFLLLGLFAWQLLFAQVRDSMDKQSETRSVAITVLPLALMQLDFTLLPGVEWQVSPKVRLVGEAGYIFASNIHDKEQTRNASGFLFRPGVKLFTSAPNRFYFQGQVFYKQVTHYLNDWLEKEVVNGVATYERLQDFRYRRQAFGFNLLIGSLSPVKRGGNSYFDFYLGVGIRKKVANVVGEENSRYSKDAIFFDSATGEASVVPSLPMGVRLVFFLR